jgi:2-(1,2-epoxy-1,2-dihydrophenyl)acetyl-CoA isomerase
MNEPILFAVEDGVAHLRLNRPDVANALDLPAAQELRRAVDRCDSEDVHVILVTGEGKRFCAGGDVRSFLAQEDPSAHLYELAGTVGAALRQLAEMPKPVVAAVQGAAAGAGLGFVLAADLVISARSTKYTMAFSNIGLTPDSGVSYLLPQVVGLRRALGLAVAQRVLDSFEALEWGLVSEVVDDEAAHERALTLARHIADGPARALGQTRRLLRASAFMTRDEHAEAEARGVASAVTTPEAATLIEQFLRR